MQHMPLCVPCSRRAEPSPRQPSLVPTFANPCLAAVHPHATASNSRRKAANAPCPASSLRCTCQDLLPPCQSARGVAGILVVLSPCACKVSAPLQRLRCPSAPAVTAKVLAPGIGAWLSYGSSSSPVRRIRQLTCFGVCCATPGLSVAQKLRLRRYLAHLLPEHAAFAPKSW